MLTGAQNIPSALAHLTLLHVGPIHQFYLLLSSTCGEKARWWWRAEEVCGRGQGEVMAASRGCERAERGQGGASERQEGTPAPARGREDAGSSHAHPLPDPPATARAPPPLLVVSPPQSDPAVLARAPPPPLLLVVAEPLSPLPRWIQPSQLDLHCRARCNRSSASSSSHRCPSPVGSSRPSSISTAEPTATDPPRRRWDVVAPHPPDPPVGAWALPPRPAVATPPHRHWAAIDPSFLAGSTRRSSRSAAQALPLLPFSKRRRRSLPSGLCVPLPHDPAQIEWIGLYCNKGYFGYFGLCVCVCLSLSLYIYRYIFSQMKLNGVEQIRSYGSFNFEKWGHMSKLEKAWSE